MKKILIVDPSMGLMDDILWTLKKLSCKKLVIVDPLELPQLTTEKVCDLAIVNIDLLNNGLGLGAIAFLQQKNVPVIAIVPQDSSFITSAEIQLNLPFSQMPLLKKVKSVLAEF